MRGFGSFDDHATFSGVGDAYGAGWLEDWGFGRSGGIGVGRSEGGEGARRDLMGYGRNGLDHLRVARDGDDGGMVGRALLDG